MFFLFLCLRLAAREFDVSVVNETPKKQRSLRLTTEKIEARMHPKLRFVRVDRSLGRKCYVVECLDCLLQYGKYNYFESRHVCKKMSESTLGTEEYLKRLHPSITFLRRESKIFYCICSVCKEEIKKWADTLHKECRCKFKLKIKDVKQKFIDAGCTPLFDKYLGANLKLLVRCPEGHSWNVKYSDFYTGYRCGNCSAWKNEKECRGILEDIFKKQFTKKRLEYLRNSKTSRKLEIDCYNEELKLGLEYNGEQHYLPVKWFGGAEGLEKVRIRDALKLELCKKNKIDLIVLPYTVENKKEFIISELKKLGRL